MIEKTPSSSELAQDPILVTPDNFIRAESDMYFDTFVKRGALGKFIHFRELPPIELPSVRPNRDTLYSEAIFDLDAGPVTITLPDAGKRFLSMIVIDEEHYVYTVVYGAGVHTLTKEHVGMRYVLAAVRILVQPNDLQDVEQVHVLQDLIKVNQSSPGSFNKPNWDPVSQKKVRDALMTLNSTLPDLRNAGGRRDQVDPVKHLIATASGWGLNPDQDAIYLNVTPSGNDGSGIYILTINDVPVDGFWSISVYDADGHFVKNRFNAYALNNYSAKKNDDGSVVIQFGGCDKEQSNCLPIFPGWNYMVRLYRPRIEILDGTWKFPEVKPIN